MAALSLTKAETEQLRALRARIGRNVHRWRVRRKLRLERCAALTGLAAESLDLFELGGGEISFHAIVRLAQILDVRPEHLLAEEN